MHGFGNGLVLWKRKYKQIIRIVIIHLRDDQLHLNNFVMHLDVALGDSIYFQGKEWYMFKIETILGN